MADPAELRQRLVACLARELGLIDEATLMEIHGERRRRAAGTGSTYTELLMERGLVGVEQANELHGLAELLEVRHADRSFAVDALATGVVSDDEVEYAFSAQDRHWRREQESRRVGDFLVDFGSMDDALKDELLQRRGRR